MIFFKINDYNEIKSNMISAIANRYENLHKGVKLLRSLGNNDFWPTAGMLS